jgi:hypothetical protein
MKRIRGVVSGLALAAVMFAPRAAEAQVQLGWNSSLQVLCLDAGCSQIQFTLILNGLMPGDNGLNPVPVAIDDLNSPGYPTQFTIDIFGGLGFFSSASVTSAGNWLPTLNGSNLIVNNQFPFTNLGSAPVTVVATMTAGGAYNFGYSGLAYIGANSECFNGATGLAETCTVASYRQGDFNGLGTNVPEPMTMGLMATGLVGLALVGYRRKKNTQV